MEHQRVDTGLPLLRDALHEVDVAILIPGVVLLDSLVALRIGHCHVAHKHRVVEVVVEHEVDDVFTRLGILVRKLVSLVEVSVRRIVGRAAAAIRIGRLPFA